MFNFSNDSTGLILSVAAPSWEWPETFTKKFDGAQSDHANTVQVLHEKIGHLTVERDFFLPKPSVDEPQPEEGVVECGHSRLSLVVSLRQLAPSVSG